ncbi:major facilitator superfamily domain-containing protein [Aspergillus filifer]
MARPDDPVTDTPAGTHDEAPQKNHTNHNLVDHEVAQYATDTAIEVDEETSKRLERMIDERVLVGMVVTYLIQTLDKGALSFASVMGILEDTNLQGNQDPTLIGVYQWLTTVVYLAILIVECPVRRHIHPIIFLLRICITLIAAANNFTALIILPIFMEQSSVLTIWPDPLPPHKFPKSSLTSLRLLIHPLTLHAFILASLFMAHSIITMVWGTFVANWMPDSPMRAKCWGEYDKRLMIERILIAVVYAFAIIQICSTIPAGGLGAYANTIIKSFGYSTRETRLLTMANGAVITIASLISAYLDRKYQTTIYIMLVFLVPSVICTSVLIEIPFDPSRRLGLLIAYWAFYSFFMLTSLFLALLSRNVAGQTKKSAIIASNFDAPRYYLAFSMLLGRFGVMVAVLVALRMWYAVMYRKRERLVSYGEVVPDAGYTHAFEDVSDRVNPHFRYIY